MKTITGDSIKHITINARVERVTYQNPENGYAVLKVRPRRGSLFTAVGYIQELANQAGLEGTEFAFTGCWNTSKYGRQFEFHSAKLVGSELLFFLTKVVKGLGERLAKDLIRKYGEKALIDIMERRPEELLNVKGIKEKRLSMIMKSWQKHKSLRELSNYLASSGIKLTPNLLIRIYNHFGEEAVKILRDNPYNLTEIRGIGFKTADKVAMGLGIGPTSIERIGAAIEHVLADNAEQNGHSFLEKEIVEKEVKELLNQNCQNPQDESSTPIPGKDIEKAFNILISKGKIVVDDDKVGLYSYRFMEEWLRDFFLEKSKETKRTIIPEDDLNEFIQEYEDREGIELSQEQKEALQRIATEPRLLFGLAGYAGTGKTTVSRAILELLSRYYASPQDIISCAFTGMASSRLRKITGFDAMTIHSLLKFKGEGQFEHHEKNPLPHKVVLLDEASMVNLTLMYRLCKALKESTLFILVGDPAQLPPIGAGNCFGDALKTGLIPSVTLKRIYRQSEDSVLTVFANEIRMGKVPSGIEQPGWKDFSYEHIEPHNIFVAKAKKADDKTLKRLREENNEAIFKRILKLARFYKSTLTHPVWEFQVLTPMRVGQLGTETLNLALQNVLNPKGDKPSIKVRGIELRKGDKVVHLQNRDMPVMPWEKWQEAKGEFNSYEFQRIFNGNVGLVVDIKPDLEEFYVVYPEKIVVCYDFDHLGDIVELAYALTVHKAQGSQYRIVAIPLTNSHFIMLNNKWFYTAITRAEEKVYIIGQEYALKRACTNKSSIRRKTWLSLNTQIVQ